MPCAKCVSEKDKPLAYKRCNVCGMWCPLEPQELTKISKRKKKDA